MNNYFHPLLIALALLTRLPVTQWLPQHWQSKDQGYSTLWFPIVGVFLGLLLFLVGVIFAGFFSSLLTAAIMTVFWVLLTGGLHLDGLADSIDAACSAHGVPDDSECHAALKEKILSVFKDPTAGPMAVVGLVLVLLLKVVFLSEILSLLDVSSELLLVLFSTLCLSRLFPLALIASTPYVNPTGLGAVLAAHIPKKLVTILVIVTAAFFLLLLPMALFLSLLVSQLIVFFLWRRFWLARIGGIVGDCIGGLIELSEVFLLFIFCIFFAL
jgi:adenosylcobinamide-GDP ribazoletransferase